MSERSYAARGCCKTDPSTCCTDTFTRSLGTLSDHPRPARAPLLDARLAAMPDNADRREDRRDGRLVIDANGFDALTRSFTTGLRRRILVAVVAAALASLLGDPDTAAHDALKKCKVPGETTGSILFGAEKEGSQAASNSLHGRR